MYKSIIDILNYGAKELPVNSGDRVRTTNLMSITTVLLTVCYLSYYWFGLNSLFMVKVNGLFALAYLTPIFLNRNKLYLPAKCLFFIILIVHVSLLSVVTFTLASGFHLYLILVVPGVYIVFDYKDKVYKSSLVFTALAGIIFCEYYDNQSPLITLSAETSRMMFQSTIVIIVLELLLIYHLSTRDTERREALFQHLADTDSLTGLFNRRYFNDAHKQNFTLAMRYQRPYSLLLIDLDFFKRVNDEYGHQAGDVVLQKTADILKQTSRINDVVARVGGEEFAIILPETSYENSLKAAENIREKIESYNFTIANGIFLNISASIGVQAWDKDIKSTTQLLKQVDTALYQAKNQGRNQVVYYQESVQRTDGKNSRS